MNSEDLRQRTKRFALEVISFQRGIHKSNENTVIGKQLLRSATSIAANYRAAGRARSKAEFFAKLSIVVEESDETLFWLEMMKEAGLGTGTSLDSLTKEATELLYIFSASRKTAKENR